jgi:hypothetical protein
VIEDQIDKEVVIADQDAFLPGLKTEAIAKLQQEVLQFVQQGILQIGLVGSAGSGTALQHQNIPSGERSAPAPQSLL